MQKTHAETGCVNAPLGAINFTLQKGSDNNTILRNCDVQPMITVLLTIFVKLVNPE